MVSAKGGYRPKADIYDIMKKRWKDYKVLYMRALIITFSIFTTTACSTVYTGYIVSENPEGRLVNQLEPPTFITREACEAWLAKQPKHQNEKSRFCSWQIHIP